MDWSGLPRRRKQKKRNKGKPKELVFLAVNTNTTNITNIRSKAFKKDCFEISVVCLITKFRNIFYAIA